MIPLVLLPGMMCDARLYRHQIQYLGEENILFCPCTEAETVEGLARCVLARAPASFALCGLSMGGIVAMEIAHQAPERIARLALLDTNPRAETHEMRAKREPQIARALAGDLAGVMREEMKPNYLAEGSIDSGILDLCMDMALSLGPEVFVRQSRALASRPNQQETLQAYRGPSLILMGAEDRLCPRDRHELMHRLIPHSRLVVIEGAGHLPTLEQPGPTTKALVTWLNME
jgi:pimeloyl-ACP methyl ester carboxylesterase